MAKLGLTPLDPWIARPDPRILKEGLTPLDPDLKEGLTPLDPRLNFWDWVVRGISVPLQPGTARSGGPFVVT
jgi:hypothetical protein